MCHSLLVMVKCNNCFVCLFAILLYHIYIWCISLRTKFSSQEAQAYTYGEVQYPGFLNILRNAGAQDNQIFVDLVCSDIFSSWIHLRIHTSLSVCLFACACTNIWIRVLAWERQWLPQHFLALSSWDASVRSISSNYFLHYSLVYNEFYLFFRSGKITWIVWSIKKCYEENDWHGSLNKIIAYRR